MYVNIVPHIIVPHVCVFQIVQFDRTAAWKEQMPRQYDPFLGTLKSPDASQHNSHTTDGFCRVPVFGYT